MESLALVELIISKSAETPRRLAELRAVSSQWADAIDSQFMYSLWTSFTITIFRKCTEIASKQVAAISLERSKDDRDCMYLDTLSKLVLVMSDDTLPQFDRDIFQLVLRIKSTLKQLVAWRNTRGVCSNDEDTYSFGLHWLLCELESYITDGGAGACRTISWNEFKREDPTFGEYVDKSSAAQESHMRLFMCFPCGDAVTSYRIGLFRDLYPAPSVYKHIFSPSGAGFVGIVNYQRAAEMMVAMSRMFDNKPTYLVRYSRKHPRSFTVTTWLPPEGRGTCRAELTNVRHMLTDKCGPVLDSLLVHRTGRLSRMHIARFTLETNSLIRVYSHY